MNFHSEWFNEDYIICPYCMESIYAAYKEMLPGVDILIGCSYCDKPFLVDYLKDVGYESYPFVDELSDNTHRLSQIKKSQ